MSASNRLARLLAMLPWLTAHPGVTWADAAQEFGISESQLVDDLQLLFVCGLPGYLPGDLIDIS
ncbi:MAG: proteasome accessory factor, partial [Frankiales bacterium]|nr:proteasome accessory factor [Frankiales bacterium]